MKKFLFTLIAAPLASAVALAQGAGANASSWTGILVSAACSSDTTASSTANSKEGADAAMPRATTSAGREQNSTYEDGARQADRSSTGSSTSRNDAGARRTGRGASVNQAAPALTEAVTTPPVDDKGTRGSATQNTPSTGLKEQSSANGRSQSGMDADRANNAMDRSCYIGQGTSAFALKLKDGRTVRFDDASNAKIAQQLQSRDRLKDKVKTFRATVKGTMQGDVITVQSIQM